MLTNMTCCVQDDPANAGLLKKRRALLGCDGERDEDDSDDDDDDEEEDEDGQGDGDGDEDDRGDEEDRHVHWESNREGKSAAFNSRDSSSGTDGSRGQGRVESSRLDKGEEEEEKEDELEKHKHKKHHKKHKHKKKKHHKKDRRQCRFLEGLTSSVVKFGTSSGDYLAASHGNNTCYQAVSGRITVTVNWRPWL